jgi:hypothetical protein
VKQLKDNFLRGPIWSPFRGLEHHLHPYWASIPIRFREAENKDSDIYEKLPLFEIEEKYGGTEVGRTLVIYWGKFTTFIYTAYSYKLGL